MTPLMSSAAKSRLVTLNRIFAVRNFARHLRFQSPYYSTIHSHNPSISYRGDSDLRHSTPTLLSTTAVTNGRTSSGSDGLMCPRRHRTHGRYWGPILTTSGLTDEFIETNHKPRLRVSANTLKRRSRTQPSHRRQRSPAAFAPH
ncbi:hypothetical protein EVAR_17699_1 [Eumeta japonica]|uniref:Uncharacterized protein n=1 Tax=Eumeta variegata TaxID=151549 RepID=A0A4C1URR9_EUMVA|nr:hypothetical protein EVAR_17699_1 [Eumeta japonica]